MINILANTTRVETPFIEILIGSYVFGKYSRQILNIKNARDGYTRLIKEFFPNYVNSVNIVKVNGTVNTYTINLIYVITPGDDPNKIDKILSNVSTSRRAIISYGDCSAPTFVYKSEETIITNVQQQFLIESSTISYTITAVSSAKLATGTKNLYPGSFAKPSDKIKLLLRDPKSGLLDIFYGMRQTGVEDELIQGNDKAVLLETKTNISVLDYLNYLVNCMSAFSDVGLQGRHRYILGCFDDTTGKYGGPYFKVVQVSNNVKEVNSLTTYELNIGFPDATPVISFNVLNNEAYALLYNYSEMLLNNYVTWKLDDAGNYERITGSSLLNSNNLSGPTEETRTWWALMTQYPVSAEVRIKGLLRPAILMTYVKLNVYFYGLKHTSSGTYIITKQTDLIDSNGYSTTLSLTRIEGESI